MRPEIESGQKSLERTFDDHLVVNNASIAEDGIRTKLLCMDGLVRKIWLKVIHGKNRLYWSYDI
jgi:hypothetical protein